MIDYIRNGGRRMGTGAEKEIGPGERLSRGPPAARISPAQLPNDDPPDAARAGASSPPGALAKHLLKDFG
jgi:hypothetical protein